MAISRFLTFFSKVQHPDMTGPLDEFSDEPFTPLERKKARKIIRDQERMDWVWATGRIWAGWISGAIAAGWAGWDHVRAFLKWLVS